MEEYGHEVGLEFESSKFPSFPSNVLISLRDEPRSTEEIQDPWKSIAGLDAQIGEASETQPDEV
jgi:hypothetical protein